MRAHKRIVWTAVSVVCLCLSAAAQDALLRERGVFDGLDAEFTFEVAAPGTRLAVQLVQTGADRAEAGNAHFTLLTPAGDVLLERESGSGGLSAIEMVDAREAGQYTVRLSAEDISGEWSLSVMSANGNAPYYAVLTGGALMLLVGLSAGIGWWLATRVQLRWLVLGAALWIVSLAVKIGLSLTVATRLLTSLEAALPEGLYFALGALYVGFESALCEMGAVILLAFFLRSMASNPLRALGIGVGAGAFEAALLGILSMGGAAVALSGLEQAQTARVMMLSGSATTSLVFLLSPIERAMTILAHMASRGLILYGFATGRVRPVVWGFLLFTGLDGVAGLAHVSGLVGTVSLWWIELMILPFALISVFAISWLLRQWPAAAVPEEEDTPPAVEAA